jgi:hypothetical protein
MYNPEQLRTPGQIVDIPLRISDQALAILRTPPDEPWLSMDPADAKQAGGPPFALAELAPDTYTLAGWQAATYAEGQLLPPHTINPEMVERREVPNSVHLLLGATSLQRLEASRRDMDGYCPRLFGIVQFGDAWRMGGDALADYIEDHGVRSHYSSQLDENGYSIIGEDQN